MPWLNWSLKLHVRLRTISHLIPPTSHMSMFNEYLIHLCDCTWLNVLYILNHMLIKHKKIFEYFELFLESVLFWKFLENPFFLATHSRRSSQSREPSRELTQKLSQLPSKSIPQSWKILSKISKFLGFWLCRDSTWQIVC